MRVTAPLPEISTVWFDLDGTLLDTARDLAGALNLLLVEEGRPAVAFDLLRPIVSLGASAMLRLGFGCDSDDPDFERRRQRFLDLYRENIATHTELFPDMQVALNEIEETGLGWGIVTNKPGWLTTPLLQALGLDARALCVVSGDTLERRKPDPDQLLYACERTRAAPDRCVYVGDARKDVEAGQRAGMRTLVALFGYIPRDEDPLTWGADGAIETPADLLPWLRPRARQ